MINFAGDRMHYGVLDIGCGHGGFAIAAARAGYPSRAIEINPEKILIAQQRARQSNISIDIHNAHAEQLPFADNSQGFINCNEVTEHVEDVQAVLSEMNRVLVPGGSAYVSFHNRFGAIDQHFHLLGINWLPRSWTDRVCRFLKPSLRWGDGIDRQSLRTMHYVTYREAERSLRAAGFEVKDIRLIKIDRIFQNKLLRVAAQMLYKAYRATIINTFHLLATKRI